MISGSQLSKDIASMKKIYDAPIIYNRLTHVYEYENKKFSIKKVPLNNDEIEAINYLSLFLKKFKGSDLDAEINSGIEKVLKEFRVGGMIRKSDKNIVQTDDHPSTEGKQWMSKILLAISECECLEITYKSHQRQPTLHLFSPYLLKEYRSQWYVIGYNHELKKVLSLALDRITKIEMSASDYFRVPNFSEDDYFNYCVGIMKDEQAKPEKIRLQFNAFQKPYILSHPLHKSQKVVEDTESSLIIELKVYITYELRNIILSYGEQVEVLQPSKLREEIIELLKKNIGLYESR